MNIDQSILACDNRWRWVFAFDLSILLYRQERWIEAEHMFRNLLATLHENRYQQESKSDINKSSKTNSGPVHGEYDEKKEEEEEDEYIDCFISDVLQELAYVLAQQGKEEEATAIKEEVAVDEAAGRWPSP